MKKSFIIQLLGLLFVFVGVLNAQTLTVTHSSTGNMSSEINTALTAAGKTAVEIDSLVVTGSAFLTYADCQAIAATFVTDALKTLDLSGAVFENNSTPDNVGNNGAFNVSTAVPANDGMQVTKVILPEGLKEIGVRFLGKFRKLTNVYIPASVEIIDVYAFVGCEKLVSLSLPVGLKTIREYAFYQCNFLEISALPASLTSLGQQAFYQTSVSVSSFPTGITTILSNCFNPNVTTNLSRAKITSLTLHEGITNIGAKAFATQKSLTSITVKRTTPPTTAADAFDGITLGNINLYVPVGSISNYSAAPWSSMIIHEIEPPTLTVTHTTAGDLANEINTALGATSAADVAKLIITGTAYVTYADCQAIATIFPTATLQTLDLSAAAFENNATPVAAGNLGAFNINADAQGLQVAEVKLPSDLITIGSRFFRRFRKLTTIVLPETLQSIGEGSFIQCDLLASLPLPAGLKGIGATAFFQCTNLTSIGGELPAGLNTLGNTAFGSTQVAVSSFPEGITAIEHDCFNTASVNRHPITSLTFHASVNSINALAFAQQTSLTSITVYRATPPTTAADAFNGVTSSNINLYIPTGSISNYNAVEPWMSMNIHDNLPSGISEVKDVCMILSSNPVNDQITVKVPENLVVESVKIINLSGVVLMEYVNPASLSFDVSSLQKSMYLMLINNEISVKFIKN